MSEEQLLNEINLDLPNILAISDIKDRKVTRSVQKSGIFPVYLHSFVKTKKKNNWLILWEARSKKNTGDNAIITFVCYYDSSHGKYAIMPTWVNGKLLLIIYAPHFFQRFADRMKLDLTGTDIIKRYFQHNANYGFQYETLTVEQGYIEQVFASSKEGIAMGIKSAKNEILLFKTFITYDMTKGEQISTFARNNKIREEIHEKTLGETLKK